MDWGSPLHAAQGSRRAKGGELGLLRKVGTLKRHYMPRAFRSPRRMDDVMIAYGQNGEAIRREQGYPLRLFCSRFPRGLQREVPEIA